MEQNQDCLHGAGECVQDIGQCDSGCLAKKADCQNSTAGAMSGPTREQVLRLAREAGFPVLGPERTKAAERFAALVAAAEREACAKEAEAEVTMEGYEKEIAAAIRARGAQ